jgi:hypothetical protein
LGASLTTGNLMIIRVTSAKWTWLRLKWPPLPSMLLNAMHRCCLYSLLLQNSLYVGVNEIISFQKLVGNSDTMTVANLGRQH